MKILGVVILLFAIGCASSKKEIVKKYEPEVAPKTMWEISDEKLNEMEKEKEFLRRKLQEKEDEIRAYRAHLGLPQKRTGKKITGYKENGQAIFEKGHHDTVEEELNALHTKKDKERKPQTVIIQNTKNTGQNIHSPVQNIDEAKPEAKKQEENILDKAFGF